MHRRAKRVPVGRAVAENHPVLPSSVCKDIDASLASSSHLDHFPEQALTLVQNFPFHRLAPMGLCLVAASLVVACGGGNQPSILGAEDAGPSVQVRQLDNRKTISLGGDEGEPAGAPANPDPAAAPGPIPDPAPGPAPAPGTLNPSITTLRTSGAAPLSMYFDATGTSSRATARPFDEIQYTWNFGEATGPGVGTWGQGANAGVASRNIDRGPIAGHVYEVPGTYTATLTAFDGVNSATKTVTVTVIDPNVAYAARVYCYSNSTKTTEDPPECAGHHLTATTWESVLANIKSVGNGAYHRLKRGDSFTMSSSTTAILNNIDGNGPGIIGDYGTATAKPVIALQGVHETSDAAIMFGGPRSTAQSGWVVKDVTISGAADINHYAVGISTVGTTQNLLALRVTGDSLRILLTTSMRILDIWNEDPDATKHGQQPYNGLAVVDCDKINNRIGSVGNTSSYPYGLYIEAERFWIAGNLLNLQSNSGREVSHGIRVAHGYKYALVHNTVAESGNFQVSFKLHALDASTFTHWSTSLAGPGGDSGGMSRHAYVGDNKTWAAWSTEVMSIGSQQDNDQGLVKDVIVEGNWFKSPIGNALQTPLVVEGTSVTVRNNLFDLTGQSAHTAIYIGGAPGRTGQRTAVDTRIYSNTVRNNDASKDFAAVVADTKGKQLLVVNNLAASQLDTAAVFMAGAVHSPSTPAVGDGAIIQANNSTISQIRSVEPQFSGASTSTQGWKVGDGSYAKGAGTPAPVWSDFFGVGRKANAAAVIGAAEQ
jgi:hypothetical protein